MEMPVPFKVKAVKIGNSIRVTIPKEVADYLKIRPGDIVQITVDNSHIIIKKGSQ